MNNLYIVYTIQAIAILVMVLTRKTDKALLFWLAVLVLYAVGLHVGTMTERKRCEEREATRVVERVICI